MSTRPFPAFPESFVRRSDGRVLLVVLALQFRSTILRCVAYRALAPLDHRSPPLAHLALRANGALEDRGLSSLPSAKLAGASSWW